VTVVLATLVLSAALCGLYLRLARRWQIVDTPNARSSHEIPTPHGGGVPLLLAFFIGLGLCTPWVFDYLWLAGMAALLMVLGVVDDFRGLSIRIRFALYGLASVSSAFILLRSFSADPTLSWLILGLCYSFVLLWALNLYNFMDGIDGIAAAQCIFACAGAAFLVGSDPSDKPYMLFCLLLAVSQLGFLLWNWAPARLFMGDAGSIPTGFLLAGLAGYGAIQDLLSFSTWLVLLAAFITDASWTLVWRMVTGQSFMSAHKLHAYQRLSRHWRSHSAVVWLLSAIQIFWLFPIAWALQQWPENALYLVILAYFPLLLGMAKVTKFP